MQSLEGLKINRNHTIGEKETSSWGFIHFYFAIWPISYHIQVCMKKVKSLIFLLLLKKLNTISIGSRHIQDWPKGIQCTLVFSCKEQFNCGNLKVAWIRKQKNTNKNYMNKKIVDTFYIPNRKEPKCVSCHIFSAHNIPFWRATFTWRG